MSSDSPIDQLAARHEAMLLRLVEGATASEVCAEFGISAGRLSVLRGSDVWREAETRLRRERREFARLRLEGLRDRAIDALSDTVAPRYLDTGVLTPPSLRLQSARAILEDVGFGVAGQAEDGGGKLVFQLYIPPGWNGKAAVGVESSDPTAGN